MNTDPQDSFPKESYGSERHKQDLQDILNLAIKKRNVTGRIIALMNDSIKWQKIARKGLNNSAEVETNTSAPIGWEYGGGFENQEI
jgi:hypothetical protein